MISSSPTPPAKTVSRPPEPDASRVMTLFVMIVATLYFGKEVLVPVTLALLLAFLLAPLVSLLQRLRLGRVPSVLLGVILALAVVLAIGGVIGTQVASLSASIPKYVSTVETKVANVRAYTVGRVAAIADRIGAHHAGTTPGAGASSGARPAGASQSGPSPSGSPQSGASAQGSTPSGAGSGAGPLGMPSGSSPLSLAERYLEPVLSPIATFGIVFVVAVFALLQREDLRDRLIRLVGSDDLHRTTLAIDDGGRRLSRYFITQLGVNTSFGVVVGIGLLLIGVPSPVLWGILSGLLRFVPYVGSFISALLPMALAAAVEPGWSMVLWTLALYVVVEGLTGQVIEPLLYGHSTGLSPFSVVVAAIFWSWLWGPIGLILSTPLTLCLVVIGRHVKRLEFLDVMLGDRPALTPVESFYQRILAGDADETQDHAERLLKECSLSNYYDEVALKALQLAANDAARGVVDHAQLDRIKATVQTLVSGLASHSDDPPPPEKPESAASPVGDDEGDQVGHTPQPASIIDRSRLFPAIWRDPGAVLCIAGRGPLDEAASAMLQQLLDKHGLGARVAGHEEVSRDAIGLLATEGVAMVCISYLDISGSPAHLRYLIRRLRDRLSRGTPILVGLWPREDAALRDQAVQRTIGADYFTSSLADAVTVCVEAASSNTSSATDCSPLDAVSDAGRRHEGNV